MRLELNATAAGGRAAADKGAAPQVDAVRAIGMRAPADAAAAPPRVAGGVQAARRRRPTHDERGAGRGGATTPRSSATYYNEPVALVDLVDGPRFRAAEAEIERLRAGHAIEMEQMRVYVETLRAYGEPTPSSRTPTVRSPRGRRLRAESRAWQHVRLEQIVLQIVNPQHSSRRGVARHHARHRARSGSMMHEGGTHDPDSVRLQPRRSSRGVGWRGLASEFRRTPRCSQWKGDGSTDASRCIERDQKCNECNLVQSNVIEPAACRHLCRRSSIHPHTPRDANRRRRRVS